MFEDRQTPHPQVINIVDRPGNQWMKLARDPNGVIVMRFNEHKVFRAGLNDDD